MSGVGTTREDPPARGDVLGQHVGGSYLVKSLLGEGGMGQVYLAESTKLAGKQAVVKVLHHEMARRPEGLARFYAEVKAAGIIDDPNIVNVFDAGELADGRPYMLMEYCSGGSLEALLEKRGALPLEIVVLIGARVAAALEAAHRRRITHRDIKPANILLVQDAGGPLRAKVADFGIAKLHDAQLALGLRTGTKKMLGSPGYMAPEQVKGAASADHRADVYAFASVIYEMTTGRRPYPGNSIYELVNNVISNAPFPRPSELRHDLPAGFDDALLAGLAHKPADRVQSVKELMLRVAELIPNGMALVSYIAPSLIDSTIAPAAATISDSMGAAATHWVAAHTTVGKRQGSSLGRSLALLAVGLVLGAGSVALVLRSAVAGPAPHVDRVAASAPVSTPAPAPAPASAPAPAVHVEPPDAGPRDAGAPVAPIDAGVAAPHRAPRIAPPAPQPAPVRRAVVPAEIGLVQIQARPWAQVRIPGEPQTYTTPVTARLPVGHYRIVLTKGEQTHAVDVTVRANQTSSIDYAW